MNDTFEVLSSLVAKLLKIDKVDSVEIRKGPIPEPIRFLVIVRFNMSKYYSQSFSVSELEHVKSLDVIFSIFEKAINGTN
jgi:hypothetical protein